MNTQKTSALYLQTLKNWEAAELALLPSEKVEHLQHANTDVKEIINRLALFGSAMHTGFAAIRRIVRGLEEINPSLHAEIHKWLGDILNLQLTFQAFYDGDADFCTRFGDMAVFCDRYNQAVQHMMLASAGVNPEDTEEALAHLNKLGLLTRPGNMEN